jgi:hypothetical protein
MLKQAPKVQKAKHKPVSNYIGLQSQSHYLLTFKQYTQPRNLKPIEELLTQEDQAIHSVDISRWFGDYMLLAEEMELIVEMLNSLSRTSKLDYWFCISVTPGHAVGVAAALAKYGGFSVSSACVIVPSC